MLRKAKIIRFKDRTPDPNYEPPLLPGRGIWSDSVENPALTLSRVVIPAGARNQRHYHVNTEAGMYVVKGPVIMIYGPDYDSEEVVAETGDFFFVPIGAIHGLENPSKTEHAEIVTFYGGVGHQKEAGTVFMEDRWDIEK